MADEIQVGEIVDVYLDTSEQVCYRDAEVLYIPQATGDSWRFKTKTGHILYVQTFSHILREPK